MKLIATIFLSVFVSLTAFAANGDDAKATEKAKNTTSVQSQKALSISGNVVDKISNESLAGATIYVDGKKVYADLDGHFVLPVSKPGKYTVKVELISYETAEAQIDAKGDDDLKIALLQK